MSCTRVTPCRTRCADAASKALMTSSKTKQWISPSLYLSSSSAVSGGTTALMRSIARSLKTPSWHACVRHVTRIAFSLHTCWCSVCVSDNLSAFYIRSDSTDICQSHREWVCETHMPIESTHPNSDICRETVDPIGFGQLSCSFALKRGDRRDKKSLWRWEDTSTFRKGNTWASLRDE